MTAYKHIHAADPHANAVKLLQVLMRREKTDQLVFGYQKMLNDIQ